MKKKSTQSRGGVKGGFPLAGSRGGAPCGVWGNAPTVPRATSMPNTLNKGAGSEASLPVTMRSRRSAPSCSPPQRNIVAPDGRDRAAGLSDIAALSRKQGISPLRRRPKGFPIALWKPSGCTLPYLIFIGRLYSYCETLFSLTFIFTQGDNHHVRIYRRSCVRKNDQFLSP